MFKILRRKKTESYDKSSIKRLKLNAKTTPWLITILVFVVGFGAAYYYKTQAETAKSDPAAIQKEKNQAESERVVTSLRKSLLITEEDQPTVARIEDVEKLKETNKDFYKDIQQGDYLIIYPKRAIIYRESASQVINVAPIVNSGEIKNDQGASPVTDSAQTQ